jgi:TrmH family RNA methyltransferase
LLRTVSDSHLISSTENELVRRLRRLARDREGGEVLLEGPRVIAQALSAGVHLELLAVREGDEFSAPADRRVVLSRGLFRTLSQTVSPQGVLAVGHHELAPFPVARAAARSAGWPLVVLDGLQDPGNVGTIARTAAAAGAPSLVVLPGTADPLGPKAVRASAGHVFNLLVARAGWDQLAGLRCVGASTRGLPVAEANLQGLDGLVLGSEAHGLAGPMETVALPMAEGVESLNVAAAAAILIYEIRRRLAS